MAYVQPSGVQGRIARFVVDGTTQPSTTQVEQFIDDVDGEINSELVNLGYAVPVTGPTWFMNRLRSLNADGAAAITLRALFPDARGPGESPAYEYFERRYRVGLDALRDGAHPLRADLEAANTHFTRNPDDDEPSFKFGTEF